MTNVVEYGKYPNNVEFSELYEKMSQQQLADYYKTNKKRINKWIKHFGLPLRPKGGGNNRKYQIQPEKLQHLLNNGYSVGEICECLNIKRSSLYQWIKKFGLKRPNQTSEYQKYKRRARRLTENTYVQYKQILNPNNLPRTLCGVDGGYQLDHIVGLYECYVNGVSEEDCASISNLQLIPWKENLKKRNYNNYNRVKNE